MNRPELRDAIWQAMKLHKASAPDPFPLIETLVMLAEQYAAGDCVAVQMARKQVLATNNPPRRRARR